MPQIRHDTRYLADMLTLNPRLAPLVADILQVDLRDVASLSAGRTRLALSRWDKLWAELGVEPPGRATAAPARTRPSTKRKASAK